MWTSSSGSATNSVELSAVSVSDAWHVHVPGGTSKRDQKSGLSVCLSDTNLVGSLEKLLRSPILRRLCAWESMAISQRPWLRTREDQGEEPRPLLMRRCIPVITKLKVAWEEDNYSRQLTAPPSPTKSSATSCQLSSTLSPDCGDSKMVNNNSTPPPLLPPIAHRCRCENRLCFLKHWFFFSNNCNINFGFKMF